LLAWALSALQLKEDGKKTEALKQLLASAEADLARERHAHKVTKELLDQTKEVEALLLADAAVLKHELAGMFVCWYSTQ
jgi:hypothetical protein